MNASSSAACRSAASSSCSAVPACSSRMLSAFRTWLAACDLRAARQTLPHFPPGCGGQPGRKRGRIADAAQLAHQLLPDALPDILGIGAASR